MKQKVLVICVHNSARSQMAEEYLRKFGAERFEVESAGLEPGAINPLAAEVMNEEGIDISDKKTNSAFEFYKQGRGYEYVITVCSKEASERCPVFPAAGPVQRLHWPFDDPSQVSGTHEQKLAKVRQIRDQIKAKVLEFVREHSPG
ncbi:MAG: arsenate reductase ArsC [Spirochaetales bacterium]|nr:arsenate reductase ArsC [Spirochaetales bacterium]